MWLVLALVGHTAKAFGFLGDKFFVEKLLPSPRALAFLSGVGGVFLFVLWPWFWSWAPWRVIAASIVGGAISVPALIYFYRAVDRDEISRVIPAIGSITPIATFWLSFWILGERLEMRHSVAFLFLVSGGVLIAFHSFRRILRSRNFSLFLLEIWVAFLFALSAVLLKYAFEATNDVSAFLWSRVGSVGIALFLLWDPGVRGRMKFSEFRRSGVGKEAFYIFSRIFSGVAPFIIWFAISYGSVSLVNAVQGVQYPLLFILALLFSRKWPRIFQEEISRETIAQKLAATLFIGIGLAFLF